MAIQVQCIQCQASLRAPENAMGKRIRCPRCSNVVLVESNASESTTESNLTTNAQKSAVIVVPAKQPSNDTNENTRSNGTESRALQNRYVVSKQTTNRNLLIAMMLMFVVILICVASGAYWLGRSSPDSNTIVAANDPATPASVTSPATTTPQATTPPCGNDDHGPGG